MTDEARIARLTELARCVWLGHLHARVELDPEWQAAFVVYGDGDCRLLSVEANPRALDALQAALLVLAGDLDTPSLDFADGGDVEP